MLIENYLERMNMPVSNPEEQEERRKDEEIMARYLSEVNHASNLSEVNQRKGDCDMLLNHFARYGVKTYSSIEEEENHKRQDDGNIALFMANTKPTVEEENAEEIWDNNQLANWILKAPEDKPVRVEQIKAEEKTENLLGKALKKFEYTPKTEEGKKQRKRDEDLLARFLAQKKVEPKTVQDKEQRKKDEEWISKYLERMNSKKVPKNPVEKEQVRKDNEWMSRFMIRNRTENEDDKKDEDQRRKDEDIISTFFTKLEINPDQEVEVSDKERRNDAALIARFLRPRDKNETEEDMDKHDHEEEIIQTYLQTHEVIKINPIAQQPDKQDMTLLAKFLQKSGLSAPKNNIDNPIIAHDEPQIDNIVLGGGNHKKVFGALTTLIPKDRPKIQEPPKKAPEVVGKNIYVESQPGQRVTTTSTKKIVTKTIAAPVKEFNQIKITNTDSKKMLNELRD